MNLDARTKNKCITENVRMNGKKGKEMKLYDVL